MSHFGINLGQMAEDSDDYKQLAEFYRVIIGSEIRLMKERSEIISSFTNSLLPLL